MATKFTPSKYQNNIYDFIETGKGNAVIDAVAGSGKTTTIINALDKIPEDESVLFLAFNKAIVEELNTKLSWFPNVNVMTLHSLGIRSVRNYTNPKIDGNKYRSRINKSVKSGALSPLNTELEPQEYSLWQRNIMKMVDLIRTDVCKSPDEFPFLAEKHALDIIDNEFECARKILRWGFNEMSVMDFTDMIYLPIKKRIDVKKYDWVFVDECQDLNNAQRQLFLKAIKPETGRFIAVGDPNQAIYGFAGADAYSFEKLASIPNTTRLPLSVCYRCDSDIVDLAKRIVPQIESRDNADSGTIDREAKKEDVRDGDMVLCRVTAPLAELCIDYISSGVKAYIKGKDIGKTLSNMIRKCNSDSLEFVFAILNKNLKKIAIRLSESIGCDIMEVYEEDLYKREEQKVLTLEALAEGLTDPDDLIDRISQIFNDDQKEGICLSTVHKSKGLESERVFILEKDRFHQPWAIKKDWMKQQEDNLLYVAYTRAKHYLGFIN